MSDNSDVEIYNQRYETFRHLDRLRWQKLQIAVASSSVILAFGSSGNPKPEWWVLVAIGLVLLILALAMFQIGRGLKKNGNVLKEFGEKIGDHALPNVGSRLGLADVIVGIMCGVSAFCFWLAFCGS